MVRLARLRISALSSQLRSPTSLSTSASVILGCIRFVALIILARCSSLSFSTSDSGLPSLSHLYFDGLQPHTWRQNTSSLNLLYDLPSRSCLSEPRARSRWLREEEEEEEEEGEEVREGRVEEGRVKEGEPSLMGDMRGFEREEGEGSMEVEWGSDTDGGKGMGGLGTA